MEDAEIERVLREYDIFQAAKAGLLIPCQGEEPTGFETITIF